MNSENTENTAAAETEQTEIILDTETVAAVALTSDLGWDILNQMYVQCTKKSLTANEFVKPIQVQSDALDARLSDPIGFKNSVKTLMSDIAQYQKDVNQVLGKHKGKNGTPSEADWPLLFAASQEYSNLEQRFDTVIAPLIFSLLEILRNEYSEIFQIPAEEPVQGEVK